MSSGGDSSSEGDPGRGWAVVNEDGDVESSCDSIGSSSSEFVQVGEDAVAFHHRSRTESLSQADAAESDDNDDEVPLTMPAPLPQDEAPLTMPAPLPQDEAPLSMPAPLPQDRIQPVLFTVDDEDPLAMPAPLPQDEAPLTMPAPLPPEEEAVFLRPAVSPSAAQPEEDPAGVDTVQSQSTEVLSTDRAATEEDSGVERSLVTGNETSLSTISAKNLPLSRVGKPVESDSDSDFVRLETSPDSPGEEEDKDEGLVPEVMEYSTSSLTGSSISSNFRFVHPMFRMQQMPRQLLPPGAAPVDNLPDDDFILDDVDDRVESDISGVAADESDLSNLSLSIGDLPLTAGVRVYGHSPNKNLNATLNIIALVALFLGLGLGLGHFIGSMREGKLRETYVGHLRTLQDDYLVCLKEQDSLQKRTQEPEKIERKWSAVVNMWKQQYEELVMEHAQLSQEQDTSAGGLSVLQHQIWHLKQEKENLYQQLLELRLTEQPHLRNQINQLETEKADLLHQLALQRYTLNPGLHNHISEVEMERAKLLQKLEKTAGREAVTVEEEPVEDRKPERQMGPWTHIIADAASATRLARGYGVPATAAEWKITYNEATGDCWVEVMETGDIQPCSEMYRDSPPEEEGGSALPETSWADDQQEGEVAVGNEGNVDHGPSTETDLVTKSNPEVISAIVGDQDWSQEFGEPVSSTLDVQSADLLSDVAPVIDKSLNDFPVQTTLGSLDTTPAPHVVPPDPVIQQTQDVTEATEPVTPVPQLGSHSVEHYPRSLLIDSQPACTATDISSFHTEDHLASLREELEQAQALLQRERRHGQQWQALYVAQHVAQQQTQPQPQATTFLTCLALLWPGSNGTDNAVRNNTELLYNLWQNFPDQIDVPLLLSTSWQQVKNLTESDEFQSIIDQVMFAYEEVENQVREKLDSLVDSEAMVERSAEAIQTFSETVLEITHSGHLEHYLNLTRDTVAQLNNSIQTAWEKVRTMSADFFSKPTEKAKNVQSSVRENVSKLRNGISQKLERVQNKVSDFLKPVSDSSKLHDDYGHVLEHSTPAITAAPVSYSLPETQSPEKQNLPPEEKFQGGKIVDKPNHKQKISTDGSPFNDQHQRHMDLMPNDLLEEGFFEGNQREWRKFQKKLRKLHGRIFKLNEDILTSMDDDDIEDLYEDLEDFQEDIEEDMLPERLKTWLTCQIRWWKGRFQRKHQKQVSLTGCSRQLFSWQLRAICKQQCHGKMWKYVRKAALDSPFCRQVLQEVFSSSDCGSKHCDPPEQPVQGFQHSPPPSQPAQESSFKEEGWPGDIMDSSQPAQESSSKEEGWPGDIMDSINSTETNQVSSDQSGMWYIHQGRQRQESLVDATWYFERAEGREGMHHDPTWYLRSLRERSLPKGKVSEPQEWTHYDHVERHLQREHEEWARLYQQDPKYKVNTCGKN